MGSARAPAGGKARGVVTVGAGGMGEVYQARDGENVEERREVSFQKPHHDALPSPHELQEVQRRERHDERDGRHREALGNVRGLPPVCRCEEGQARRHQ